MRKILAGMALGVALTFTSPATSQMAAGQWSSRESGAESISVLIAPPYMRFMISTEAGETCAYVSGGDPIQEEENSAVLRALRADSLSIIKACPQFIYPVVTVMQEEGLRLRLQIDEPDFQRNAELSREWGPFFPEDLPSYPEGFDILGATPGVTLADFKEMLIEPRGLRPAGATDQGDAQEFLDEEGLESIGVLLADGGENTGDRAIVTAISRHIVFPEEKSPSADGLADLLIQKYGPAYGSAEISLWRHALLDLQGNAIHPDDAPEGADCLGLTSGGLRVSSPALAPGLQIFLRQNCGATAKFSIDEDADGGVRSLSLAIFDGPGAMNAMWRAGAAARIAELERLFEEASANAVRHAPEL